MMINVVYMIARRSVHMYFLYFYNISVIGVSILKAATLAALGWILFVIAASMGCANTSNADELQNEHSTWGVYGGDLGATHYSNLAQINRKNVDRLEVVWRYQTGDMKINPPTTIQCNPIVIDKTMFVTTPGL